MPEWPDLRVLRGRLEAALVGQAIVRVRTGDPTVIRAKRPPGEVLAGRTFRAVRHRGKLLLLDLDGGVRIVVNPMLAGVFELLASSARLPARTALSLDLDDGTALRYRDDKRMGKVYVLQGERIEDAVPGFADLGPDAGTLDWTGAEFARRARRRGGEVRNLLMDQRFVAGIGNAYADEILWAARLHPKTAVRSLDDARLAALRDVLASVLDRAVEEVEGDLPPELGTKVRAHLRVRGRAGEPCPRCGGVIRRRRKGDDETDYCSRCQPPPPGQLV